MIIAPNGRPIIASKEMTRLQTQTLIDAEAFAAEVSLALFMRCVKCVRNGAEPMRTLCKGDYDFDGVKHTFTVACDCTKRTYSGTDLVAPILAPRTRPKDPAGKVKMPLAGHEAQLVEALGQACKSLELEWTFRCVECHQQAEKTSTPVLRVDCSCTTRYAGSPAVASTVQ